MVDDGMVIDLARLRSLSIDPRRQVASAGGGLTTGEYTTAAAEYGLATGFGDEASVGIGGLTLGGGIGYLVRKHGLTIDDLLGAEIVTADGQVLFVDEANHPDLFWAIRGGGGNFGVVTRLRFRLHELGTIVGGMLVLPASAATIRGFIEAAAAASPDLSTIANVMVAPPLPFLPEEHHGQPVIMATLCFAGPLDSADRALASFRAIAEPVADMLRPMPYPEIYPASEGGPELYPAMRNLLIDDVTTADAEVIIKRLHTSTAPFSAAQIRVLGGAMAEVSVEATAFAHRQRKVMMNVAAMYADPAEEAEHKSWVDDFADDLHDGQPRAAYVNFIGDEGADRVHDAFPTATWNRLAEVKRHYDPMNVFMLNQNISPTS